MKFKKNDAYLKTMNTFCCPFYTIVEEGFPPNVHYIVTSEIWFCILMKISSRSLLSARSNIKWIGKEHNFAHDNINLYPATSAKRKLQWRMKNIILVWWHDWFKPRLVLSKENFACNLLSVIWCNLMLIFKIQFIHLHLLSD